MDLLGVPCSVAHEPSIGRGVGGQQHRQLTDAGRLRAPSFQGFRDDKDPDQCTYDQLVAESSP